MRSGESFIHYLTKKPAAPSPFPLTRTSACGGLGDLGQQVFFVKMHAFVKICFNPYISLSIFCVFHYLVL